MESLRDIIGRYLDRAGLSRHLQADEVRRVWEQLLGEAAEHARLDSLRGGVALFVVDSAALLSELNNFRKAELLAGLQGEVKGLFIRDIKFRPGPPKAPERRAAGDGGM